MIWLSILIGSLFVGVVLDAGLADIARAIKKTERPRR